MHEEKSALRKEILQRRSNLSLREMTEKSERIAAVVTAMPHFRQSKIVMAYMSFRNEVLTAPILEEILSRRQQLVLPRMEYVDGKGRISPRSISCLDDLIPGAYGILEPAPHSPEVAFECIDMVIVPGVGFDKQKYRMGYGAGYYDAFLPRLSATCCTVGVGYDLQLVDRLPIEAHDVPLHIIITESGIIQ